MKLQDFVGKKEKWSYEAIADDTDLTRQIQVLLIGFGLLDPPADGKFGPISTAALKEFQQLAKTGEIEFLGPVTAEKLIETKPEDLPKPPLKLGNDIASRIIKYMQAEGYQIFTNPREYNIIYIEGMTENWTLNSDTPNEFNDRRVVIEFTNSTPKIVNHWQATTEPGSFYTYNPMNPKGAARIKFGQYKAWAVGYHGNADRHEALVQVAPITVLRDFNKDFKRTGDKPDTGLFAVNQHWGYDAPKNDIKNASAGCLVGRTRQGHREFMSLIKQDKRFVANNDYVFYTTVIPGDDLLKRFPG
ncbi:MAG TPA: peptidoglycan-binding domain-containing protein [Nostocaceae cyanobacterium]|nr:peptidoglycan-binding domain-containing protein [Nostocaceae cyanobacterium]